ncbi:MAG: LPS assembly protein LptD [Candidatus Omnitrophota bacterium]
MKKSIVSLCHCVIVSIVLLTTYNLQLTTALYAEEQKLPVSITGDIVEYFEDEKMAVGEGNVTVIYKDMKLTCDKLTFYTETKDAIAEGNVILRTSDGVFKGRYATYNFEAQRGKVEDARAEMHPWYAGCKECERMDKDKYGVKQGYVTTCNKEHPHYRVQAKTLEIYPDNKVVAKNAVLYVWKIPIFYFPYYVQSTKQKVPDVSFVPGSSKKWGFFLLSKWRYNLDPNLRGNIHVDWREYRGWAPGLDVFYKTKKFGSGAFRAYYMEDRDKNSWKRENRPRDFRNRYRFQVRHRWLPDAKTNVILEYHKASDNTFIKDFFYREEYEIDPQPPTYISLTRYEPAYSVNLKAQKRVNRFETAVEYLPEVGLTTSALKIGGSKFYYNGAGTAGNLSSRFASSEVHYNANRLDLDNKLSYVEKLFGWLSVTPYTGTRQTYYSKDISGDNSLMRGIFYGGVDFSTRFYRVFNCFSDVLGIEINKIKHTITPTVKYFYQHSPTVAQNKIIQFDGVDSITTKNRVTIALENYFQTKWFEDKQPKIHDLARFIIGADYIFRENGRGRLDNISFNLETRPYHWLGLSSDASYNPKLGRCETYNLDVLFQDKKEIVKAALGYRYLQEESAQLTAEVKWRVTPKWLFRVYQQYEFQTGKSKEKEFAIVRDLHCWEAEVGYNRSGPYGRTIFVIFRLKAFPDIPLAFSKSFARPRTLEQYGR